MADFCKDCSIEMFGKDMQDLAGLTLPSPGAMVLTVCESCGWVWVDKDGKVVKKYNPEEDKEYRIV